MGHCLLARPILQRFSGGSKVGRQLFSAVLGNPLAHQALDFCCWDAPRAPELDRSNLPGFDPVMDRLLGNLELGRKLSDGIIPKFGPN